MGQMSLYDILRVNPKASQDEIKKAYYRMSKDLHPDKGGDPEKFKILVRAYDILFDPDKRARYDSGETPESLDKMQKTEEQEHLNIVLQLFFQAMVQADPDQRNIFKIVKDTIQATIKDLQGAGAGSRPTRNRNSASRMFTFSEGVREAMVAGLMTDQEIIFAVVTAYYLGKKNLLELVDE